MKVIAKDFNTDVLTLVTEYPHQWIAHEMEIRSLIAQYGQKHRREDEETG